jgi:hypothetical protein
MISPKRVGVVRSRTRRSKDSRWGLDRRHTHAALSDEREDAEETAAARDSDGGEAQFEEALPGFLADSLLPLEDS